MRKRERIYFTLLVFWLLVFSTGKAEGSTSQSEFFQVGSEIQFEITRYDTTGVIVYQNYIDVLIEEDNLYESGGQTIAYDRVNVQVIDGIKRSEYHYFLTNGLMTSSYVYYSDDIYTFPWTEGYLIYTAHLHQ